MPVSTIAVAITCCVSTIALVANLLHWAALRWRGRKGGLFVWAGWLQPFKTTFVLTNLLWTLVFLAGAVEASRFGMALLMAMFAIQSIASIWARQAGLAETQP